VLRGPDPDLSLASRFFFQASQAYRGAARDLLAEYNFSDRCDGEFRTDLP